MVQWLRLHTFTGKGPGSIPGWGTKILKAVWCGHTHTHTKFWNSKGDNLREGPHQEAGGLFGLFHAFLTSDRSMKLFTDLNKP